MTQAFDVAVLIDFWHHSDKSSGNSWSGKLIPSPQTHFFLHDYQVTDQSYFALQRFTQPNAKCLAVVEGDYSGLVSVVNDQAANYSFDYKGPGQKWLPN